MKMTLSPSHLCGCLEAPPSKSCMHRALICAAASDKKTKIKCSSFSKDIEATISCLKALGAEFEYSDGYVIVTPVDRKRKTDEECVLNCNESGSTLRFMLPFAASLGKKCKFIGAPRLGERPLKPLCDALASHGVKVRYGKKSFLPCYIEGQLQGGDFTLPGDISSQFITGILFALGVAGGGNINIEGPLESAPYIDITTNMQKHFGIDAVKTQKGYSVPQGQSYIAPCEVLIEGDYSNGAFWLVAGAISAEEKLTVSGLWENTLQGDGRIVEILREMGAHIERKDNCVTVCKSQLKGIEIDCADIPDIVPVLCVAASAAEGVTIFKNTERLRAKESDRVKTTVDMLSALGGKIKADENTIRVEGGSLHGGNVTSANDHRIAMSAAVAALTAEGDVIIDGAEAVAKSYPDFYEKYKMLGGKVK